MSKVPTLSSKLYAQTDQPTARKMHKTHFLSSLNQCRKGTYYV